VRFSSIGQARCWSSVVACRKSSCKYNASRTREESRLDEKWKKIASNIQLKVDRKVERTDFRFCLDVLL